jgi:branched-chain amino acid transport system substrate-binding protein
MKVTGVAALAALSLVASACSEDRAASSSTTTGPADVTTDCTPDDLLACARTTSIGDLVPDEATEATGEPMVIGMINQENTPAGSFPELSAAAQAGIDWVNEQLDGVDGRPIELEVCNTEFSPEGSTACAQQFVQEGVEVVLGGIDVFGNGIDTLDDNGIPYIGGIPVSPQSVVSPNSFQWSGGTWGAAVAFAYHAATVEKAEKVAIIYGEFGSIADGAAYGETTLKNLGVDEVQLVPYPILATDLTSPLQAAAAGDPDAVFLLAADTGCKSAFDGVQTVGLEATMYYVGACAAPKIVDEAGPDKTDGAFFNVEQEINGDDPDPALYNAVVEAYGNGLDPIGAGTVSFRSFMNLYRVLREVGGDAVSSEAIIASLESQVDAPSFMGHSSTCDHQQLQGLPSTCAPQQVIAEMEGGDLTQVGGWVDVGDIYGTG